MCGIRKNSYLQNIRLHYSIYVLSHGVLLHSDSLLKLPGQFPPSFLRPSHVRVCICLPPPQLRLHCPTSPHSLHCPFTKRKMYRVI